jgi:hypothetical protein
MKQHRQDGICSRRVCLQGCQSYSLLCAFRVKFESKKASCRSIITLANKFETTGTMVVNEKGAVNKTKIFRTLDNIAHAQQSLTHSSRESSRESTDKFTYS